MTAPRVPDMNPLSDTTTLASTSGTVFAIDETATHDGPGLRMTVYLKGCPLHCVWCHSPESISPEPETVWYQTRCLRCGQCLEVCPHGFEKVDGEINREMEVCRTCGLCVESCPAAAMEIKGYTATAAQIVARAERLTPFFRRSGGGVTLTGGEPMLQFEFAFAVASLCQQSGIHVAIETTGFTSWKRLEKMASVIDLFLFDFKHADDAKHREFTGVSNQPILENLRRLLDLTRDNGGHKPEVLLRVPVIPSCNGSPDSIRKIGETVAKIGATRISLLPFNPAASGKYAWFLRDYPLQGIKRQTDEEMRDLESLVRVQGLEVVPP
ncbi:MAG: glycyl-radical enzyme activating protein [Armatimonadetes bacterium]|nr:glycyl-radical enzyme activating protein [Armatimonadota bacterium]